MKKPKINIMLASPEIRLGDTEYNLGLILETINNNTEVDLFVFPELFLTGATLGDYYFYRDFRQIVYDAISKIFSIVKEKKIAVVFGSPFYIIDHKTHRIKIINTAISVTSYNVVITPKENVLGNIQSR
jgi:predicted amidohydrolase